jgi:hypothetical protein
MHAAFPGALTAQHESELRQRQPDIRTLPHVKADAKLSKPVVIDCFVRQNLGEIRTHRNLVLLAPLIVALTPAENRDQVGRIMKMLVADEIAHIAAMAHFINLWALNGERAYIQQLHRVRLAEQNAILVDEIAPHIEFLGSGAFPMLRSRAT